LELIEPKTPLFAHGCRGVLYKYLNTIQDNIAEAVTNFILETFKKMHYLSRLVTRWTICDWLWEKQAAWSKISFVHFSL